MNKAILSLCVFGAGLAATNILIMPRPTCPSAGNEVTAAYKEVQSTKTQSVSTAKDKPPQAPNATATKPASAPKDKVLKAAHGKPSEAPTQAKKAAKPAAKPPAPPPPTDADVTGSVKVTAKPETPAGDKKIEDEPEEWAEVSIAAKAHEAPSVSSPTVRYYRLGTRLKVMGRESGWVKIADPATSNEGWIYEKYLTPEGSDQQKSAQTESNDANVATPAQPGPYARPYRSRKYGWKRYRYPGPPVGFAIRVYPRW
jgi:hypothetical protein